MRNRNELHRAAMGALVAAALMAGAAEAGAAVRRFPADTPAELLPLGRAKRADDGSGGAASRLKLMLASVWRFPDGGSWVPRLPARRQQRSD